VERTNGRESVAQVKPASVTATAWGGSADMSDWEAVMWRAEVEPRTRSTGALLEILDPQRFVRGTPVEAKLRDEVMVRRLKADLREVSGGFPVRNIVKVNLEGLPTDAPELALARLLDEYWEAREKRLEGLPPRLRAAPETFCRISSASCFSSTSLPAIPARG